MQLRCYALALTVCVSFSFAACGAAPAAPAPTTAPAPSAAPAVPASRADLSGIKTYLTGKTTALTAATAQLQAASDRYYKLAKAVNFDYAALATQPDALAAVRDARVAWRTASPLYEQMEGIVAGTSALAQFDVDLDAGSSQAEGGENVVSFDLTLPNGQTLAKPGNVFGVTESTLWGTFPAFSSGVKADIDANSKDDFADLLPDANVLKAGSDTLARMSAELQTAANTWTPTESDAFTALVVMVPTMTEYFESWKNSREVAGTASTQRDFVAISRLSDIQNILGSLQVVHQGVSPLIQRVDAAQDQQIGKGLADLKSFVADVERREQSGKRFSAEDADTLGVEAQNRATAITGQVTQAAAQLNIPIKE